MSGTIVLVAPHADDEVLACGGILACLPQKDRIHVIYATDGSKSPVPIYPWQGPVATELPTIRGREARHALRILGIPPDNIHFLGFPDGRLKAYARELRIRLSQLLSHLKPDQILIPFRYDRHPDHLALHQAAIRIQWTQSSSVTAYEYFVYYRWRMLVQCDIRKLIQAKHLLTLDIGPFSMLKKQALESYKSQTTLFYPWQDRPILPQERVTDVSAGPEVLLRYNPDFPGTTIFSHSRFWIPLVHYIEPRLKNQKERFLTLIRSMTRRVDRSQQAQPQ